ncbi:hypothetical protein OSB04_006512 [Centaurea solstitialis]|uniref:C2H2-type domain-containing protein n=1 Tax=Centaurea solstitialis TaxID=347529 RepID=A0AA38WHJ0_9ASTR|nr:hypothetical protein OSB04_006512 [Centaurea solstitialis]
MVVMKAETNLSSLTSSDEDSDWTEPTSEYSQSSSMHVETGSMSDSDHQYLDSISEVNSTIKTSSSNSITHPSLLETLTTFIPRRPRTSLIRTTSLNHNIEGRAKASNEEPISEDRRQTNKRYRESEGVNGNDEKELEGLNVIDVKEQRNIVARGGDGACGEEVASESRGGMSRAKLVGFMESLQGEWVGRRQRRRKTVVQPEEIVNALPENWKIELDLRKRRGIPSIYRRRYVRLSSSLPSLVYILFWFKNSFGLQLRWIIFSTPDLHFKSCKEAAFFLRDQFLSNVAEEGASEEMRQMKNGCHIVPESVNEVCSSSVPEANVTLPATDNLFDVKVASLIECSSCGIAFEDLRGLEKHLAIVHKKTTRRFDLPTTEGAGYRASEKQHAATGFYEPKLEKPCAQQNGEGSSSLLKIAKIQESVGVSNGRFKTNCTWCNKGFVCEPVDAETMADATGFMCPQCKDKICGGLERSLSRSHQP